ncbi:MAG: Bug family tripartite tricarboxylate transporter substrate binding protein [Pontibacterium sp.]
MMLKTIKSFAAGALMLAATPIALASDVFPNKAVTIVVPFNPGGGVDTVARVLADKLSVTFGQNVLVENKPGGSGMIGARSVVKAKADGYTLLLGSSGETAINAFVYKEKMRYSPEKDLAPVTLVTKIPNVMLVSPKVPGDSIEAFVKHAKANPGALTYATSGTGNSQHLNGELLNRMAGIEMIQIPYKGASKQLVDVASGDVDATFVSYAAARAFIADGKVTPLGVTSAKRAAFDESIPALAEYEPLKAYQLENWFGLFAPANTPKPVLEVVNAAVVDALNDAELSSKLSNLGGQPAPMTLEEFADFLATEREQFKKIVESANISIR